MELKEIQELAAAKSGQDNRLFYENVPSYMLGFHQGAKWEREREKWFDPEKVLPPRNQDQDTNRSIYVLVKDSYDTISEKQYNFQGKYWEDFEGEEGKVISWAYIPN